MGDAVQTRYEHIAELDQLIAERVAYLETLPFDVVHQQRQRLAQLEAVAEAAESVSGQFSKLYDMLVGRTDGSLSEGIEEVAIEVDVMRRKLAALKGGKDDEQ